MTSEQRERAIGILTAGMSARDVTRQRIDNKLTTEQITAKLGTSQTYPDQADHVTPRRGKTVFSRLHLDATDFFLVES